jgi:hypothetical protein
MGNPNQEKWAQLVMKTWQDDALRKRLLADPAKVLAEHGIDLPAGVDVKVVENSPKVFHMVLPPKPFTAEVEGQSLDEDKVNRLADGLAGAVTTLSHC